MGAPEETTAAPETTRKGPVAITTEAPDNLCQSHPGCAGLTPDDGLCCPVANGIRLACCDQVAEYNTSLEAQEPSQALPTLACVAVGVGVAGIAVALRRKTTPFEEPLIA